MSTVNVSEAAAILDVTPRQVRNLITAGKLRSEKLGHDHIIQRADLAKVRVRRPGPPEENKVSGRWPKHAPTGLAIPVIGLIVSAIAVLLCLGNNL